MASSFDLVAIPLAARQHGVVTSQQLRDHGIAASTINRRVTSGSLTRIGKGVYAVAGLERPRTRLSAALLLTPNGVASHRTAARLHKMPIARVERVELTAPRGRASTSLLAVVRETRSLPDSDITQVDDIRTTSPARTICDLAAIPEVSDHALRRVIQSQLVQSNPSASQLLACHQSLARRGRNGTVRLRELLLQEIDDQPYPQSKLELLTLHALLEFGITYLRRQFAPPWYDGIRGIVDFADPVGRTILEADGRTFHSIDQDRIRDRARDRQALLHGWMVIRIGWQEIAERPEATMDEISRILSDRRNQAA